MRTASIQRTTNETRIALELNLDGTGTVAYTHLTLPTMVRV